VRVVLRKNHNKTKSPRVHGSKREGIGNELC